ncbi:MAG: hypothetical protein RMK73_13240 [Geminicoccaceae bacterium]|nr:hypothetical protein [Geminicoccaceae bacterium]
MLVLRTAVLLLITAVAHSAAVAGPAALSPQELDRITAGATAWAELTVGNVPPQVVPEPPRNPREFWRWLRRQVVCSLPGRACALD